MTHEQILLIKNSWKLFRQIDPELVGGVFYSKLFIDSPGLRKMFRGDMESQYRKLIEMLSIIVARLEKLDEMTPDIEALAKRHIAYGVRPEHYKAVGKALLWTLRQGLGGDWNNDLHKAWAECYNTLSSIMIAPYTAT